MKDDRLYLTHVLECIERVKQYVAAGRDAFFDDEKTQDAVVRNLQVMAESTIRLSTSLKEARPEVGWQAIAGFRNVLVHDYLGLDLDRIWAALSGPMLELEAAARAALEELNKEEGR